MRVLGLGPTELIIIGTILLFSGIVPAIATSVIAKKAGYSGGQAVLWAIVALFASWLAILFLGIITWPRDRAPEVL